MRHLMLLVMFASTAGCLRQTEFQCQVDGDCTAMGSVCESTNYCSFVDMDCPDGRRYGGLSGPYANQCVGDQTLDGGIDSPSDGSAGNCPASYATLPNAGTHLYKRAATAQNWNTQRLACVADGAYLAIPDDATELAAIIAAGAAAKTWLGISDMSEGTFVTVVNSGTPPFLDIDAAEPNTGNQDCVVGLMSSGRMGVDGCDSNMYPAVCECEP